MNILIVTPFYKHDKNIASVRWTNIATRLAKRHNVIVVTQPHNDMDMTSEIFTDDDGVLVARINQKTAYEKFAVKHLGGATGDDWQTASAVDAVPPKDSVIRKLKNRVLYASMKQKAKQYAAQIATQVISKDTKIDVVISSACPFIEMLFGYELKKQLGCKWISDFRDLPYYGDVSDGAQIAKRIMKKALASADVVTSITHSGKEYLAQEVIKDADKIHVVTNGFSLADAREAVYQDDGILHIVHTGSLYGGTRRADLFFKAAQMARQQDPAFCYRLECAGGNSESLIATAQKYGEEANVENFGFIPRTQALDLQGKADILLALICKTKGSFSAKLFEYTLNRKPIVCVSRGSGSDDVGEETRYVRDLRLGIAVEEETESTDVSLLCEYLLEQYRLKAQSKPLTYDPDTAAVTAFDHDQLVAQVENLCL